MATVLRPYLQVLMLTLMLTATGCGTILSNFDKIHPVWKGEGPVPTSHPGFKIAPSQAHEITHDHYGPRKNVWHIYADKSHYYVVDGFFGSNSQQAKRALRIDGQTGEIVD